MTGKQSPRTHPKTGKLSPRELVTKKNSTKVPSTMGYKRQIKNII